MLAIRDGAEPKPSRSRAGAVPEPCWSGAGEVLINVKCAMIFFTMILVRTLVKAIIADAYKCISVKKNR